jgi:hypothetical protein
VTDAVLVASPAQSPDRKWTRHTLQLKTLS